MESLPQMNTCKYCNEPHDPYKRPALKCSDQCGRYVHTVCLSSGGVPGSIAGDVFFDYVCAECSPIQTEILTRKKLSWLATVVLTLYHLREKSSGISNRGYFHWNENICSFIDAQWKHLKPKGEKKKRKWQGTISGTLSHSKGVIVKSGTEDLGDEGWWKLIDNDPPEVILDRKTKMTAARKSKSIIDTKDQQPSNHSPIRSESSFSVSDDSNGGGGCGGGESSRQTPSMFSREYVQPTEILSNFLLADDDIPDIDLLDVDDNDFDDQSVSLVDCDPYSSSIELFSKNNHHLSPLLQAFSPNWVDDDMETDEISVKDEPGMEEELYNEDSSNDGSITTTREPPLSLFTSKPKRDWPWRGKNYLMKQKRPPMSKHEEEYLFQNINKVDLDLMTPAARRFYRKLATRKAKRDNNLAVFDLDHICRSLGQGKVDNGEKRVIDRFLNDNLNTLFEQRLQGHCEPTAIQSPYTNRLLKPFIRRDTSCRPLWLRIMEELQTKVNGINSSQKIEPIDYCYVRPQHIPAINSLCSQFFWPGIDLTECLQYPDFTCVVLYKKLVIGFAALVPDVGINEAYISFLITRPEWRKSGIGTFMLYHLVQTCMGKDITLHVSATNPAVILYQKFGFKSEEFIQDFYDKYVTSGSKDSRHALFLRLSR